MEPDLNLPDKYLAKMARFTAVCQSDRRVVAAALYGSYARGTADSHSDLDLFLVSTDEDYETVLAERSHLGRQLGEPLFLEDFEIPDHLFAIYSDGAEIEIGFGCESDYGRIFNEHFHVLVDKKGLLSRSAVLQSLPSEKDNLEILSRQINWFWHDLSHFITAISRGQLWWAVGQLEVLRNYSVTLARLKHNMTDRYVDDEIYFKIESFLPSAQLVPLESAFSPLERESMLQAALVIIDYFTENAPLLARANGLTYPVELEQIMLSRLAELG